MLIVAFLFIAKGCQLNHEILAEGKSMKGKPIYRDKLTQFFQEVPEDTVLTDTIIVNKPTIIR